MSDVDEDGQLCSSQTHIFILVAQRVFTSTFTTQYHNDKKFEEIHFFSRFESWFFSNKQVIKKWIKKRHKKPEKHPDERNFPCLITSLTH